MGLIKNVVTAVVSVYAAYYVLRKRTRIIGITGGIACGKTAVSDALHGPIIDADIVYSEVVAKGSPTLQRIVSAFGPKVLTPTGDLDRVALADIVFGDSAARRKLNSITHPAILWAMLRKLASAIVHGEPIVYLVAPLLYESGPWLPRVCHRVAVVAATPEIQLKRLMARNSLTEEAARARIAAQMPLEEKIRRADDVIENNGSLESLHEQVAALEARWRPRRTLSNAALGVFAAIGAVLYYLF